MDDLQEPFRVCVVLLIADGAETWHVSEFGMTFVEWVRKDPNFDGACVLRDILFEEMCRAGCFEELSTLSIFASDVARSLDARGLRVPSEAEIRAHIEEHQILERERHVLPSPQHKLAKNYSGPCERLAHDFEDERVRFSAGRVKAREYIGRRVQLAVADIWSWIRNGRLTATGIPVQNGREDRAREIRGVEVTERMTLGAWDGWHYQGPDKDAPAWKSVFVSRADFMRCVARTTEPPRPTAKAENDCYKWLKELMAKSRDRRPKPKMDLFREASVMFPGLGNHAGIKPSRSFERAWGKAMVETKARWSTAGPTPKSPR